MKLFRNFIKFIGGVIVGYGLGCSPASSGGLSGLTPGSLPQFPKTKLQKTLPFSKGRLARNTLSSIASKMEST
jgi:hypothetical protein